MHELRERLNKLKNYNDTGRNLPSPLPGDLPQPPSGEFSWVPLSSNYNNNINNYNDDDDHDFPLPPSVSQYSSHIPPSNDIPQAPLIFTPWPSPTSGSDLLKTYWRKTCWIRTSWRNSSWWILKNFVFRNGWCFWASERKE